MYTMKNKTTLKSLVDNALKHEDYYSQMLYVSDVEKVYNVLVEMEGIESIESFLLMDWFDAPLGGDMTLKFCGTGTNYYYIEVHFNGIYFGMDLFVNNPDQTITLINIDEEEILFNVEN